MAVPLSCVSVMARRAAHVAALALLVTTAGVQPLRAAAEDHPAAPQRLPARLLVCTLGHATNFDPEKEQTTGDIAFDTRHRLSLFLPGSDQRTAPPPDAFDKPEAVAPGTRVIDDPDQITADAPGAFERVVDLWPERVELAKQTKTGAFKTFLISDYDPVHLIARIFLGTASDLTTYDLKRIYMGECAVTLAPATLAPATAAKSSR